MKPYLWILLLCVSLQSQEYILMKDHKKKHCVPCEGGAALLTFAEIKEQHELRCPSWELKADPCDRIQKRYIFKNFVQAVAFINAVSTVAEQEGHHPNIVLEYNNVTMILYTHALNGLSINDFIVAELIDKVFADVNKSEQHSTDRLTTLQSLKDKAYEFVDERDWHQFHNLRNLSMSIVAEAAELMELFLWKNDVQADSPQQMYSQTDIEEELSDVLLGVLTFANRAHIDMSTAFAKKLAKLKQKYTVQETKGKNIKIRS